MNPEIALSPNARDVQASHPATRVSLSRVGVTGVEKVISLGEKGHYHAELECYVDLASDQAGVHMSRFEENVSEAIEDWSDQASAEKKVKGYRADLTKTVKRAERRGTTTRRKATTRARKRRNSLEKTVRKQRKNIEKSVKTTNKDVNKQIEARVNDVTKRANKAQAEVSKVAEEQGKKAQDLVNKVTEQLQSLV